MRINNFRLKYSLDMYHLYYQEDNKYLTDGCASGIEISINENNLILDGRIFIII